MGVRITDRSHVCLYCSTDGTAFGPVFADEHEAQDFLDWLASKTFVDPRAIPVGELLALYSEWSRDGDKTDVEIYGAGAA